MFPTGGKKTKIPNDVHTHVLQRNDQSHTNAITVLPKSNVIHHIRTNQDTPPYSISNHQHTDQLLQISEYSRQNKVLAAEIHHTKEQCVKYQEGSFVPIEKYLSKGICVIWKRSDVIKHRSIEFYLRLTLGTHSLFGILIKRP